jgi:hypothetical protein
MLDASIGAAMSSWIIFIAISVLAVAFLSGRFTAEYAAEKGRSNYFPAQN